MDQKIPGLIQHRSWLCRWHPPLLACWPWPANPLDNSCYETTSSLHPATHQPESQESREVSSLIEHNFAFNQRPGEQQWLNSIIQSFHELFTASSHEERTGASSRCCLVTCFFLDVNKAFIFLARWWLSLTSARLPLVFLLEPCPSKTRSWWSSLPRCCCFSPSGDASLLIVFTCHYLHILLFYLLNNTERDKITTIDNCHNFFPPQLFRFCDFVSFTWSLFIIVWKNKNHFKNLVE